MGDYLPHKIGVFPDKPVMDSRGQKISAFPDRQHVAHVLFSIPRKNNERKKDMKTILKFTNPAFALVVLACFGLSPVLQATDLGSVVGPVLNANTGDGAGVLTNLTTGVNNSGFGYFALDSDTSGSSNTAFGRTALFVNTTGNSNTAIGKDALRLNNSSFNTATGFEASITTPASPTRPPVIVRS
jgi:hypothetical protein